MTVGVLLTPRLTKKFYVCEKCKNTCYLLENLLKLLRQRHWLTSVPGLIQRPKQRIRENMVEQAGSKDARTAGNKQRGPVLLQKHRESEKT